jgi:hypothetical protein
MAPAARTRSLRRAGAVPLLSDAVLVADTVLLLEVGEVDAVMVAVCVLADDAERPTVLDTEALGVKEGLTDDDTDPEEERVTELELEEEGERVVVGETDPLRDSHEVRELV